MAPICHRCCTCGFTVPWAHAPTSQRGRARSGEGSPLPLASLPRAAVGPGWGHGAIITFLRPGLPGRTNPRSSEAACVQGYSCTWGNPAGLELLRTSAALQSPGAVQPPTEPTAESSRQGTTTASPLPALLLPEGAFQRRPSTPRWRPSTAQHSAVP